jgi:hypothetical protein
VGPNALQANPKQAVGRAGFRLASLSFEQGELMPEGQIFEYESRMGLATSEQAAQRQHKELEHDMATLADQTEKSMISMACGVFATDRDLELHPEGYRAG